MKNKPPVTHIKIDDNASPRSVVNNGRLNKITHAAVNMTITYTAGRSLLVRLIQKCFKFFKGFSQDCTSKIEVIKYPDNTKKTSTPKNPPDAHQSLSDKQSQP